MMYFVRTVFELKSKIAFVLCLVSLSFWGNTLSATNFYKNRMKELIVKKINAASVSPDKVPNLLDKENIPFQMIDVANWSQFPYIPKVQFRIAHTESAILLQYKVKEASVRALAGEDNGPVWKDACVEFFSIPAGDGIYYNIECNCAGFILIGAGSGRTEREHAPAEILQQVQRWSSLGHKSFAERMGECSWEVALVIPYSAFFKHHLTSLDGKEIRANFYKCGDELDKPHYLSWNPINLEKPNFHCPEFFGTLFFE